MMEQAYLLHALSPLHAGIGTTADVIDMPIARMQSTGIPIVPGSSIKGVLRDARKPDIDGGDKEKKRDPEHNKWLATFGPEDDAGEHAGAVVIGDARLLALPVRSFKGTFAWVSSPLLLLLAARDLQWDDPAVPQLAENSALVANNSENLFDDQMKLYLQDIDVTAQRDDDTDVWAQELANILFPVSQPEKEAFTSRFVLVDDEIMTFLWETATQVDTRIRINGDTGVVAKGALWMEESLSPETLLIGLMAADRSRRKDVSLKPDEVMKVALGTEDKLQFGGKASVGRGRCRVIPVKQESGEG